jgi:hypothetical protein
MRFRWNSFDVAPLEAKRMHALLAEYATGKDCRGEAHKLISQINQRRAQIPVGLPNEFILVHAPRPGRGEFDEYMQRHRMAKEGETLKFPYWDYSAHPIHHVAGFAGRQQRYGSCVVYFVPHRTASSNYNLCGTNAPFALHYECAFPGFQTIDLNELEVARGPYAGQAVLERFHAGPCVIMVKRVMRYGDFMKRNQHRPSIVYATWTAALASPYGTWKGKTHVRPF